MIRSPFFELWISTIAGISLALWPTSGWVWLSIVALLVLSKSHSKIAFFVLLSLARANLALQSSAPAQKEYAQTYEPLTGLPRELSKSSQGPTDEHSFFSNIRKQINAQLESPETLLSGFRKAIVLGYTTELPADVWASLNYLGLSHLLVISGSHISFLLALVVLLAKRGNSSRRYYFSRLIAVIAVSFFMAIANRDLSIVRAFLCFCLISIGAMTFPSLHRWRSSERLSLVAILVAFVVPLSAMGTTYLLSFGTSWALLRAKEFSVPPSIFAQTIAPYSLLFSLCGVLGLGVHPLSIFANFLFGSVFSFLLLPLSLISIFARHLEPYSNKAIEVFFLSTRISADWLARHSPTEFLRPSFYIIFLICVLTIFQIQDWNLSRRIRYLISVLLVGFAFNYLPWHFDARKTKVEVQVLDVSQGDALLLRFGNLCIAIDGGGPRLGGRQLLPALKNFFGEEIDLWIFSHFDQDHRANFEEIEARISTREIWIPRYDHSYFTKNLKRNYLSKVHSLTSGSRALCSSGICWTCFSAFEAPPKSKVGNDDSLACALWSQKTREIALISTGDLPAKQEPSVLSKLAQDGLKVPPEGILALKLGHHGSKTSSSADFLSVLRPHAVIVNAGRNNQYGFPHSPVMQDLKARGIKIFRVDALGNFKVHFDI